METVKTYLISYLSTWKVHCSLKSKKRIKEKEKQNLLKLHQQAFQYRDYDQPTMM